MKPRPPSSFALAAPTAGNSMLASGMVALALLMTVARAGLPQPMCIYYGQALDGFGMPYTREAEVILLRGGTEVARHRVQGSLVPGVNFALYTHIDDGRSTMPYSSKAVRSGDVVSIQIRDAEGVKTIMPSQVVPPVSQPGEIILVNVTAAYDADADGLSDTWEQELAAASDGVLKNLSDVRGIDDFDQDGMSNLDEYRAGTIAFLDYDALQIESVGISSNGRFLGRFWGVSGRLYRAERAADLATSNSWTDCPVALSDSATFQIGVVEGTGNWLWLYLPLDAQQTYFRLIAY